MYSHTHVLGDGDQVDGQGPVEIEANDDVVEHYTNCTQMNRASTYHRTPYCDTVVGYYYPHVY